MSLNIKKVNTNYYNKANRVGTENPSVVTYRNQEKAWGGKPTIPGSQDFLTDLYKAVKR